ncbi:hypothetical protein M8J75_008836 [Diaphorina citri]|nr:hypothetical protein M8J75_008836 [Diaphorina citri]
MGKRRRASSLTRSVDDDDDSSSHTSETPTMQTRPKRKKIDPSDAMQQIYDVIRNFKKEDGALLCDPFIRIPKKRQEPSYHEVVTNPIDFIKIQQKLKTDEYDDLSDFQADIELLVKNAKTFYKRNSQEHRDAQELMELFHSTRNKLLNPQSHEGTPEPKGKLILKVGKGGSKLKECAAGTSQKRSMDFMMASETEDSRDSSICTEDEQNQCEDLFNAVMTSTDADSRPLHEVFQLLPSKKRYPEYYDVIDVPIDLRTIARRIQDGRYASLGDMEKDLILMTKNACTFNEPGSQIYKDAKALKKLVQTKKIEIEQGKFTPAGKSERIRSKRIRGGQSLSAITAALESEDDESEDDEEIDQEDPNSPLWQVYDAIRNAKTQGGAIESEDDEEIDQEDPNSPLWQVYDAIRNAKTQGGGNLSEPFLKLPAKRYNPDYYRIIKNPRSLLTIGKTLKSGHYSTLNELTGELNLMFENAKKFNPADSRLYRDAVKLQKLMQRKVQEFSLNELTGELNLMFENAKKFNPADLRLYRDAVKLQKLMQRKVQEVLDREGRNQYDEESDSDEEQEGARVVRARQKVASTSKSPRALTRGKYLDNKPLKRRLYTLCKCLMDYRDQDGRQPMLMFMELPSAKIYPEYYKVIKQPIDMCQIESNIQNEKYRSQDEILSDFQPVYTGVIKQPIDMCQIESNIQNEKYRSQDEILSDFRLMFGNCREFNEPGSLIYEDAVNLEKVLLERVAELGPLPSEKKRLVVKKTKPAASAPSIPAASLQKMRILYNTIKETCEPKTGRQLSHIFQRLPSRHDYPDYYEVIRKPVDMEMIASKLRYNQYEHLDEMVADFIQMFDNACKYNEPDSHIYKDALSLQRIVLQTKMHLREDEDSVPDVPAAVQELLTSLFTSVYNHQDEEGRCFSDSMAELPEHDELPNGTKVRAISLDLIKRRLDSGQYRRLDMFQDDLFACMDRARTLSRTDSQVFEDSVDELRQQKLQKEIPESHEEPEYSESNEDKKPDATPGVKAEGEGGETKTEGGEDTNTEEEDEEEGKEKKPATPSVGVADNAMSFNQQVYRIGDFIYSESKDKGQEPYIVSIERLWTNNEGQPMMYGNQYFRPDETFHVATRKFLEKEVFKSDVHLTIPLKQIQGRCAVVNVKDYFKFRPEGFDAKDVYVCESRYSSKSRSFKKIAKYYPPGHRWATIVFNYKLIEREVPLEPNRVVSVFSERVEKHKQELTELEEREKFAEKVKPNVLLPHAPPHSEPGCMYYEQFNSPTGMVIKTGDCVYVCTDPNNVNAKPLIAQIDRIWTDKAGNSFIHGPYIVLPADIVVPPNKIFYQKEVLLSNQEATNPTTNIIGKCTVLEYSEYISCRPTEIPESEVYIVESMYDDVTKVIRDLPPVGLKKYSHTPAVYQDEIYFFRRLLNPPKVGPTGLIVETPQHTGGVSHATPTPHTPHHHPPIQSLATPGGLSTPVRANPQHMGDFGMGGVKEEKLGNLGMGASGNSAAASSVYPHTFDSNSNSNSSQMLQSKMEITSDLMCEDSMDGPPPSVCSVESTPGVSTPVNTPVASKKVASSKKKALVTGYILYSGEVRKQITINNPDRTFGEVSRIVGNEWRSLPAAEKTIWEEKAARINEESAKHNAQVQAHIVAQIEAGILVPSAQAATNKFFPNHPDLVWECLWDNCDFQFEDMHDCIEHAVADGASGGHIHATFAAIPPSEVEYQCQWRGCSRLKKPFPPFPSCTRLARHVKEVHILKNPGKVITAEHRSKNHVPAHKPIPPSPVVTVRSLPPNSSIPTSVIAVNEHVTTTSSHHLIQGTRSLLLNLFGLILLVFVVNFVPRIVRTPATPQNPTNQQSGQKGTPVSGANSNLMPQQRNTPSPSQQNGAQQQQQVPQVVVVPKPLEPLFITDNRTVSRYESQLRATPTTLPPPEPSRLPSHWLGNGVGQHGSVLNALWRLRDFMFKDALAASKLI